MSRRLWRGVCVWLTAVLVCTASSAARGDGGTDDTAGEEAQAEQEQPRQVDPKIFDEALDDFYSKDWADAAAGFWGYIHFGEPSAENYEWAQYFLAECLRHLGLWDAAVTYYTIVAKTRSRPEILPKALRRLEAITRTRPFNEDLVYDDLLYDSEFGSLPDDMSRWVSYVQGLYDYRNKFRRWGKRHFSKIPTDTYYGLKAEYVLGVDDLRRKKDTKAVALFKAIVGTKLTAPDVKNEAYMALARLAFDAGQYADAMQNYDQVQQIDLSYQQAELLLEKAWTAYHLQHYRQAMGLLHALNAPSYQRFFLPDAYVLRGLILKDLCHFIPAKRVVRSFRFRFGRALRQLHRRLPMQKIRAIWDGATQDGSLSRRTAFLRSLESERKHIEDYDSAWEDVELDKHLRRLYDLEIREQTRRWRLDYGDAAHAVAEKLLDTQEQVNLLDYEIGLDIFKRLKAKNARRVVEKPLIVPYDSKNVYYEFDTEYWNDELHSYKYFITNRCFDKPEAQQ